MATSLKERYSYFSPTYGETERKRVKHLKMLLEHEDGFMDLLLSVMQKADFRLLTAEVL